MILIWLRPFPANIYFIYIYSLYIWFIHSFYISLLYVFGYSLLPDFSHTSGHTVVLSDDHCSIFNRYICETFGNGVKLTVLPAFLLYILCMEYFHLSTGTIKQDLFMYVYIIYLNIPQQ